MPTLCARNPPVMDGFLVQRVSNVGFDVFFVVSLNIGLKEQWFEMSYPSSKWFTCLLTLCARNPPVMDGFLVQRVSNVGFDVFFVVSLNIGLKEQWFEMSYPSSKWFTCLLTLCARNPPVMDGFLVQRGSNVGFYVFFVVSLNIGLKEQLFEMSYLSSKWFTCLYWYFVISLNKGLT